jgi:hypothetical protein
VKNLWLLVKDFTDAMAAEFTDDREAVGLSMTLNGKADIAKCLARSDLGNALPEALVGYLAEAARPD